ncbi:hypothetical protein [Xanthomonas fragariae]|uniref:hypothetical protein n=1 Tax=Xanthomonas fragariae TaxID=48664 RepID=UPI001ABDB061|nr:hypothetical protein [Xanthomonas fragariae]UKR52675.1 hypothetical protein K4A87_00400 [Xanthomonas fragariae]
MRSRTKFVVAVVALLPVAVAGLSLSGFLVLALVNSLAKCKAVVVEKDFGWAEWPRSRHGACSRAAWL